MRALTLHQPHATLMKVGAKTWETRGWRAPDWLIGNLFAIHAGKVLDDQELLRKVVLRALPRQCEDSGLLPRGGIVAVVRLVRCRETTEQDRRAGDRWSGRSRPEDFGDFSAGRWVWETQLVLKVHPAIMCRGYQHLWEIPANIAAVIEQELPCPGSTRSGPHG